MRRCAELGAVSDEEGRLTRTFHSPAMARANALVGGWMREAGLEVREDVAFNLIGRLPSANPRAKTLLIGSHLDTVINAGKYDGPLGVMAGLAAVQELRGVKLPFHVEIIGFSDEEGVRYQTAYLGSRAMAGTLSQRDLATVQEKGIEAARRDPAELLGYAEVHIEQGPVLEAAGVSLGVVSGIAGQTRARVEFAGHAGHAGTTPMDMRRDALCAAAEFILKVEQCGVTATVGQIEIKPGASNVIPERAVLSVDIRHLADAQRLDAVEDLPAQAQAIGRRRNVAVHWTTVQQTDSVICDPRLTKLMHDCAIKCEPAAPALPSGAGHDAAPMSTLCPVAMLFVRCKGGLSHHPDEAVSEEDARKAITVLCDFILALAEYA